MRADVEMIRRVVESAEQPHATDGVFAVTRTIMGAQVPDRSYTQQEVTEALAKAVL